MLDHTFFDSLSRLQLKMPHKSSLNSSGSHRSLRKGSSTEFSDFREYMPGDDLRRMDWNVYARLDKLYIREYMEEKEAQVRVLIDTSASMDYGADSKAELARDLAAVVSFLALNNTSISFSVSIFFTIIPAVFSITPAILPLYFPEIS